MKRFISILFVAFALLLPGALVYAEDDSRSYSIGLEAGESSGIQAETGDIITLTLRLTRTDSSDASTIYAFQDEITYDSNFFELVEDTVMMNDGLETRDLALRDNYRAFYVNYVDLNGGSPWEADTVLGTFQLKVTGAAGASVIENRNAQVSNQDGSESYAVTSQDMTVTVSDDCLVTFESNGGSAVDAQTVAPGEKVKEPEAPTREGYSLDGWYSDYDLQNAWDFDQNTVSGNMTLYARWTEGEQASSTVLDNKWIRIALLVLLAVLLLLLLYQMSFGSKKKKVRFETNGGTKISTKKVKKGEKVKRPKDPKLSGQEFAGWYRDEAKKKPWDFDTDTVKKNMTLYAKWK